jgi:uncharacterized radical SAM superfamily Fe-S cluster-containing enzyme
MDRFLQDARSIVRYGRSRTKARLLLAASVLRNFNLKRAPSGLSIAWLTQLFHQLAGRLKQTGQQQPGESRWRFLTINAVWFEDPFNVDFEAVCRSCAPVATEEGEFSFCSYNSMGWRQIVENRQKTASLPDWHRQNGRHTIYANGATIPLEAWSGCRHGATEVRQEQAVEARQSNPS